MGAFPQFPMELSISVQIPVIDRQPLNEKKLAMIEHKSRRSEVVKL